MSVCNKMQQNNDHINDPWYHDTKEAVQKNNQFPSLFIRHYYEINKNIADFRSKNVKDDKKRNKVVLRFDRYLYVPKLQILISPPIVSYASIHSFVKKYSCELPGLLHGVVDLACTEDCFNFFIYSDGSELVLLSCEIKNSIKEC